MIFSAWCPGRTMSDDLEWQSGGLCFGTDDYRFTSGYREEQRSAAAVCLDCPVKFVCLEYGLDHHGWGVWGGHVLSDGKPSTRKPPASRRARRRRSRARPREEWKRNQERATA